MMRLAASMAGVALMLTGCNGAPPDDYLPLNDISDPDAATSVAIELPAEGSSVDSTFEVEVQVNGDLSSPDEVLKPNGLPHLHFRLDGGAFDPDQAQLDPIVEKREDPAAYSPSVKTRLTYEDVPPGEHVLLVDLVRDDHDPAAEIAGTSVTFRVKDE